MAKGILLPAVLASTVAMSDGNGKHSAVRVADRTMLGSNEEAKHGDWV